jgi:hypothetical protein
MDDLRDYRFYSEDMLHPTAMATEYIWQKFISCYLTDDAISFVRQWREIVKALEHRPFHPTSREHQQFILKTIERIKQFSGKVNVEKELLQLNAQLI